MTASAVPVVVDSFTTAFTSVTYDGNLNIAQNYAAYGQAGYEQYGYTTGASGILGGRRYVGVNDGHSGVLSPGLSAVAIDTTAGAAQLYGNASAIGQVFMYGSAIHNFNFNSGPGLPVNLNLSLTAADLLRIDFSQSLSAALGGMGIHIYTSTNNYALGFGPSAFTGTAGTFSVDLASFGMDDVAAADIQGLQFDFAQRASAAGTGVNLTEIRFGDAANSAVPDSTSIFLLPLTLGALLVLRRKAGPGRIA